MFSLLALVFLFFAFGVLLCTFVWIARLLAQRADEERRRDGAEAEADRPDPGSGEAEPTPADRSADTMRHQRGLLRTNATLGLILALLACLLVPFGPLVLTLSVASLYYSGQALWIGLRHFRLLIGKAAVGLALGGVSVLLQYLALTGQLAQVVPVLG